MSKKREVVAHPYARGGRPPPSVHAAGGRPTGGACMSRGGRPGVGDGPSVSFLDMSSRSPMRMWSGAPPPGGGAAADSDLPKKIGPKKNFIYFYKHLLHWR